MAHYENDILLNLESRSIFFPRFTKMVIRCNHQSTCHRINVKKPRNKIPTLSYLLQMIRNDQLIKRSILSTCLKIQFKCTRLIVVDECHSTQFQVTWNHKKNCSQSLTFSRINYACAIQCDKFMNTIENLAGGKL